MICDTACVYCAALETGHVLLLSDSQDLSIQDHLLVSAPLGCLQLYVHILTQYAVSCRTSNHPSLSRRPKRRGSSRSASKNYNLHYPCSELLIHDIDCRMSGLRVHGSQGEADPTNFSSAGFPRATHYLLQGHKIIVLCDTLVCLSHSRLMSIMARPKELQSPCQIMLITEHEQKNNHEKLRKQVHKL
jgi:hypothetical protein